MGYHTTVFLLIGIACCASAANQKVTSGDVIVEILGQSGKMKIWRPSSTTQVSDNATDVKPITIFLDSLTEVDQNGNPVGTSGSSKHSFNTFASQDFTFSSIKNGNLPHSNITVSYVDFQSQLSGLNSIVKLTVYIVKEDGEFVLGNDTIEVKKGEVKFSIELSNWSWCGCSKGQVTEVGAFVDVELTVQLHGSQKVTEDTDDDDKGSKKFTFGEGQNMITPKTISIDGSYVTFPTGYPKFALKGNKNSFTFRFEKFTSKALYDPTINAGELEDHDGGASVVASLLTIIVAFFTAFHFI